MAQTKILTHDLPLWECIKKWDELDEKGTNRAMVRNLCLYDLAYLMIKVLQRKDIVDLEKPRNQQKCHNPEWVYNRIREVEADPDGHLDLWARSHFKSSIITNALNIQELLRNPEVTICIISFNVSTAEDFLKQIKRELETNTILWELFPDVLWVEKSQQTNQLEWRVPHGIQWTTEGIVVRRTGNPKESTIMRSGLIDGVLVSKHFDILDYDDCVQQNSVSSPDMVNKTNQGYELSKSLGKEDGSTRIRMIGTRWAPGDTWQYIMASGGVKVRIYTATVNGTMFYEKNGKRYRSKTVLMSQKLWNDMVDTTSEYILSCQYLQNPLAGSTRMFDFRDIRQYQVRPATLNVYILCDPARSKKKGSDKTAIAVIGIDKHLNKFLLDGFNHRMDLGERWQAIRHLWLKWSRTSGVPYTSCWYEAYGALADLDYFRSEMKKDGNPSFPVNEIRKALGTSNAKVDRIQRLQPDIRQHKLLVPYPTKDTLEELTEVQRRFYEQGLGFLISQKIRKKNEDGEIYDLSNDLLQQVEYFPLGNFVDLLDAVSRIYDADPSPPSDYEGVTIVAEENLV